MPRLHTRTGRLEMQLSRLHERLRLDGICGIRVGDIRAGGIRAGGIRGGVIGILAPDAEQLVPRAPARVGGNKEALHLRRRRTLV